MAIDRGFRKTKIICTIGPATRTTSRLRQLLKSGMDVARLNYSHGTLQEHGKVIDTIRSLRHDASIMGDLQGPKIRVGALNSPSVTLSRGQEWLIGSKGSAGDRAYIPVDYNHFSRDVQPGQRIFLDDGSIELMAVAREKKAILARVVNGGTLSPHKGVNLPDTHLGDAALSRKDRTDLRFSQEKGIDFIALSFARSAKDILAVRRFLQRMRSPLQLLAKIETAQGVAHLDEIIEAADGVIVARGDLGVELSLEKVPWLQKQIIATCNRLGKVVVTATQMLESMTHFPRPTRAEASDVANAIVDGSDALLLSGETAIGQFPLQALSMAKKIARQAEENLLQLTALPQRPLQRGAETADAIAHAACQTALHVGARLIVAYTQSGATARLVAKYRPKNPILALTTSQVVARQLRLLWGVVPSVINDVNTVEAMVDRAAREASRTMKARAGDLLVITGSIPVSRQGKTNMLKVHQIGSLN
jgi:pyruvate kinase